MFRSYQLQPITAHNTPISFEWDAQSGRLRGNDADLVAKLAQDAKASGEIIGHPYPTSFQMTDPLHLPSELAVVLGNYWKLPPDLADAYPQTETDDLVTEIDENGVEHPADITILY